MAVPSAANAEDSLSYDELQSTASPVEDVGLADPKSSRCSTFNVIQHQKEVPQSHVTVQTKFSYARGLIKSPKKEHQVKGVGLSQGTFLLPLSDRTELNLPPRYLPQRDDSLGGEPLLSRFGILYNGDTKERRTSSVRTPIPSPLQSC